MFQGVQIETQSEQQALTDWHAQRTAWRAPRAYPLQGYRTQGRTPFQTLSEGVEQMRREVVKPQAA